MKAALLKGYGGIELIEIGEMPTPRPGPGEVLVNIKASAINPFDIVLRQGSMAQYIPLPMPAVLGGDAAGIVAELGEGVTGFAVGDRVVADFIANGRGAHAEYGLVPATAIAKLPAALSYEQGASLVKAGLTGWQTVGALCVKAGDRVLVSGALGSVGRAAIQRLSEMGAIPVAGVRSDRLEEARELAGEALDINVSPTRATFDYAISTVGPVAEYLIAHVRDGGHVASIVAVPEGANPDNRVEIHELYHYTDAAMLEAVLITAAHGRLLIPIALTLPLEQIGAAQDAVATGIQGKVVLQH